MEEPPVTEFAYDVFLSYNSAQKDWTRDLARRLRDSGFNAWFNEWCLRGGENWIVGLRRGVNESRHVVFVVSPESIDAVWPMFEVYLTIFHDPIAQDRKLIPVIHTECDLPDELAIRQCIDFSESHDNPQLYDFRLAQLMADMDRSRERPADFELWLEQLVDEELAVVPPIAPLPRGSVMPLRPNPHFVGREDELRELERLLRAGSTTAIGQVAAATGLGGIGKTQLAVEYVHRYGRRYRGGVFWLDMEDPSAIASEVARCGGPEGMDLPRFDALSLEEQVARVKREWQKPTLSLLIFDNVTHSEVVEQWRPVTGGCRVLITSQRTDWPSGLGLEEVRLSTLPRDKAVELLCKGRPEALEDDGDREAADSICQTLGDLPLAVALAGAYLEFYEHEVTLSQYLELLRAQPVLENPALVDFVQEPSPTDHVQNVAATFEVSYRRLDANDDSDLRGMRLFHLASHFAPVSIRRDLLVKSAGVDPELEHERRSAGDALGRLIQLGLMVEETEGRLLVHRLLGEFARHHPAPGQSAEAAWKAVAVSVLVFAVRENETGLPAGLARELSHLGHVAAEAENREWPEAAELLNNLGFHLRMVGAYHAARGRYARAVEIREAVCGCDHPDVASVVNNLGLVLHDLGDLAGARDCHDRALGIAEAKLDRHDPRVATYVNSLGLVLKDLGDVTRAEECYRRALDIDEAVHGKDHPAVARDLNNLAGVLREIGDLKGAEESYQRALAIAEATYGEVHPKLAAVVNNLGGVLRDMGDLDGAREWYERALEMAEATYGKDHPRVAIVLNNLAGVRRDTGDLKGAQECYKRTVAIRRRVYGEEHPKTQTVLRSLKALGKG